MSLSIMTSRDCCALMLAVTGRDIRKKISRQILFRIDCSSRDRKVRKLRSTRPFRILRYFSTLMLADQRGQAHLPDRETLLLARKSLLESLSSKDYHSRGTSCE